MCLKEINYNNNSYGYLLFNIDWNNIIKWWYFEYVNQKEELREQLFW